MKKTITKEFGWDCAHRLWNPDKDEQENRDTFGLCSNIHGHFYKFFVTVSSQELKDGMVINFKDLKQIVKTNIVDEQDHCLNLTYGDPLVPILRRFDIKLSLWPDETTCENQIEYFWNQLEPGLKKIGIILEKIKLYETPTSFATLTR